jgi:hypothetical protein
MNGRLGCQNVELPDGIFFREYWPVVVASIFARFGAPVLAGRLSRNVAKSARPDGAERRSGVE